MNISHDKKRPPNISFGAKLNGLFKNPTLAKPGSRSNVMQPKGWFPFSFLCPSCKNATEQIVLTGAQKKRGLGSLGEARDTRGAF